MARVWTKSSSRVLTYGFSVTMVAAVLALRLLAWPWLHDDSPFLFFIAALAISAWFGGFHPGLLATALSALCVAFYLLPPFDQSGIDEARILQLVVFCVIGGLISSLMSELHAARASAEGSERKAAQRAAESESGRRILEALMTHIPQGVAIVDVPEGRIRQISDFWSRFLGRPRAAVQGMALESLLDRRNGIRPPEDSNPDGLALVPLMKAIRGGEVVTGEEWSLKRGDGAIVPVLCSAGPIRDQAGNITSGVISWHDLTAQRRVENQLRETQADLENRVRQRTSELDRMNRELDEERHKLFSLLDTLPFFVCLLARDHSVQFQNLRFRTLFPAEEDRPPHAIVPGNGGSGECCHACRARETQSQVEWQWTSKTGRHYEIYETPFAASGADGFVLEIGVDITERREAEQGIEQERNKLLGILRSMRQAVYIVNPDNELQFTNPAYENEFGPVMPGVKCHQQLHGRSDLCEWCRKSDVFAGQSALWEWESPINRKVYDVFECPIFGQDGSALKLKILHDVTEHKRTQDRLRHNEELMRNTLETLPVGVWFSDKNGNIISGNARAQEIWGGARYAGPAEYGIFKAWRRDTGKLVRAEEWALARAMTKGEKSINEELEIEAFDGTRKIILNSAAPVRDETGQIIAGIAVNQDITSLKQGEEKLARQHKLLESLWTLNRHADEATASLHDRILSEMLSITGSRYGFLGVPSEDETFVDILSWSQEAYRDCRVTAAKLQFPIANAGIWANALRKREAVIINDYSEDHPDKRGFPEGHVELKRVLVVPTFSGGRVVMVAAVANKEKEYASEDVRQVTAFLASTNAILAKKWAEEALKRSEKELQRLSSELLRAQESERMRISRELHDDLGQSLTSVKLRIGLVEMGLPGDQTQLKEHCQNASSGIDAIIENIRRLSRDLRPAVLEDLGFTAALKRLVAETVKASRIRIHTEFDDIDPLLPAESSILLYRIFQETLNNIMKHADAREVRISAKRENGGIAFEIQDDGMGMESYPALESGNRGLGLSFVKERIRTLGGSLDLWTQKGAGTRISFSIPIRDQGEGN